MKAERPIVLVILDGWGIGEDDAHNAIFLAKTPNIDHLLANYPNGPIGAAGEHIGLEPGHQGSTEMGHLIISAGRNVMLPQIQMQEALKKKTILKNEVYLRAMNLVKQHGSRLHLMGLLSDAGVHSYDTTCHLLLELAHQEELSKEDVFIHIFSDGRDSPPTSLPEYVEALEEVIEKTGVGQIASVMGRYWAMDRDNRWERIQTAYDLLAKGKGLRRSKNIHRAIEDARIANETDEFISPTVIYTSGHFQENDVVINFNYRVDREIEITKALIEPNFGEFKRVPWPLIHYIGTFEYYTGMSAPHAFERLEKEMKNILPVVLSERGYTQYRLTETEKWVYVTKIFNAMHEEELEGEKRHLIPSDDIATYDEKPEMQAIPIAQHLARQLKNQQHDFYVLNICNADILGHTGHQEATQKGCEAIDKAIGIIYKETQKQNGVLIITADHGDAEKMWDFDNDLPHTQHTDSFVPFILVDEARKNVKIRERGSLKDVAPTILDILGEKKPHEMTGESLVIESLSTE